MTAMKYLQVCFVFHAFLAAFLAVLLIRAGREQFQREHAAANSLIACGIKPYWCKSSNPVLRYLDGAYSERIHSVHISDTQDLGLSTNSLVEILEDCEQIHLVMGSSSTVARPKNRLHSLDSGTIRKHFPEITIFINYH